MARASFQIYGMELSKHYHMTSLQGTLSAGLFRWV